MAVLRVCASWLSRHARSLPLRVRAHAARRAPTDRPCVTALSSARSHVTTLARRARASRAFSAFRVRSHSVVAHRGATCSTLRSSSAAPWRLVSRSTRSTQRSGGGARVHRLRGAAARRARRRAHRDRRLTPVTTRCCTSVRCVVCWRMLPYLGIFVHIGIFVCVRDIHILIYIASHTNIYSSRARCDRRAGCDLRPELHRTTAVIVRVASGIDDSRSPWNNWAPPSTAAS